MNLSDLPKKIGVSASMFYLYRKGAHPISDKAWRKLETAELLAGIWPDTADQPAVLRENESRFRSGRCTLTMEERMERLEDFLKIIAISIRDPQ